MHALLVLFLIMAIGVAGVIAYSILSDTKGVLKGPRSTLGIDTGRSEGPFEDELDG